MVFRVFERWTALSSTFSRACGEITRWYAANIIGIHCCVFPSIYQNLFHQYFLHGCIFSHRQCVVAITTEGKIELEYFLLHFSDVHTWVWIILFSISAAVAFSALQVSKGVRS